MRANHLKFLDALDHEIFSAQMISKVEMETNRPGASNTELK